MNIENKYPVMIFKNEYQGKIFYNIGLSKKDRNGSFIYGNMPCQFRKGVEVPNKTKIMIKSAWIDFYLKDKETKPYVFINEFTMDSEVKNDEGIDVYATFGTTVSADDPNLDLPF